MRYKRKSGKTDIRKQNQVKTEGPIVFMPCFLSCFGGPINDLQSMILNTAFQSDTEEQYRDCRRYIHVSIYHYQVDTSS